MKNLDMSKLLALKLSSLNETDFNWVYSQLDDGIKEDLDPIIREIKEIGFEIDSNSISTLIQNNVNQDKKVFKDKTIQILDNSTYADIVEVFKSEPSFLLNTLISYGPWGWEKDQNYIDRPKTGSTKVINNIKSKKLLEKSIISATVFLLQHSENVQSKNKDASKLLSMAPFASYLNKFIRPTTKWKF